MIFFLSSFALPVPDGTHWAAGIGGGLLGYIIGANSCMWGCGGPGGGFNGYGMGYAYPRMFK